MSNISVYNDNDLNEGSKVLFEIVAKNKSNVERCNFTIDKEEFLIKGVELRLGFFGYGKLSLPIVEDSIICTQHKLVGSGQEVIFRIGRTKCSKVKVVISYDDKMFLECSHLISQEIDFLSQKTLEIEVQSVEVNNKLSEFKDVKADVKIDVEKPTDTVEILPVCEDDSEIKDFDQLHSIYGSLYYVVPAGEKEPKNVCLNGIRIKLYNSQRMLVSTRITRRISRKNGFFKFSGLNNGEYYLKVLLPSNLDVIKGNKV
ncbi:MAG: hypothetical protein RR515_05890, partial [Clostridium sp.]